MSGSLTLRRRLDVRAWRVVGTIARPQRRNWEPAVLLLAKEKGWVSPELVATELLDGRRPVAAKLVAACRRFGLLSEDGDVFRATDDGLRAAETQEVLVPERGTWIIWAADDPMLGSPVIAIAKSDDGRPARGEGRRAGAFAVPLPGWIPREPGLRTFDEGERAVRILDFGEQAHGEPVANSLAPVLELRLDDPGPSLRLTFTADDGRAVSRDLEPPSVEQEDVDAAVRRAVSSQGWPSVDHPDLADGAISAEGELEVPFAATSDEERSSRHRTVRWTDVLMASLGRFETATLEGVSLQPRTRSDAEEWVRWRLLRSVDGYATTSRYEGWAARAAEAFPVHAVVPPSREVLAASLRGGPETDGSDKAPNQDALQRPSPSWWHLAAPADWRL